MSPHAVVVGEFTFRTAEHLFQSLRFDDIPVVREIMAAKSPMGAKMVAKKHLDKAVVVPRSEQDLDIMRNVLKHKLVSHPDLIKALMDTGDHEIVEDVTNRPNESGLFWGKALINGEWVGQNHLGKLWMETREFLIACAEP